jgi:hypothetical protein
VPFVIGTTRRQPASWWRLRYPPHRRRRFTIGSSTDWPGLEADRRAALDGEGHTRLHHRQRRLPRLRDGAGPTARDRLRLPTCWST